MSGFSGLFITPLVVTEGSGVRFVLAKPLIFQCVWDCKRLASQLFKDGDIVRITVKPGLVTDFASVPKLLWPLLPPHRKGWRKPAVLHDALYQFNVFRRITADLLFYHALRVQGVSRWKAKMFYWAVRVGGRKPYVEYGRRLEQGEPPLAVYNVPDSKVSVHKWEKGRWITFLA